MTDLTIEVYTGWQSLRTLWYSAGSADVATLDQIFRVRSISAA